MLPKTQLRNELAGVAVLTNALERVVVGAPGRVPPGEQANPDGKPKPFAAVAPLAGTSSRPATSRRPSPTP